ncbi:TonB-dependent receptor [bacterium]|nr:TonB-dependent receptor [bacterium]
MFHPLRWKSSTALSAALLLLSSAAASADDPLTDAEPAPPAVIMIELDSPEDEGLTFGDVTAVFQSTTPWVDPNAADVGYVRLVSQDVAQPLLPEPSMLTPQAPEPEQSQLLAERIFRDNNLQSSLLASSRLRRARAPGSIVVQGNESQGRATSDVGSLLFKSNAAVGVASQRRSPIVTDTRVRGLGLGNLKASGSYWYPARDDMDTMLSKIDSRIISDVIVTKGPYSVEHGPGLNFVDFQLQQSPRYSDGQETHGSTSLEYQTNGEAFYGRQMLTGGDDNWGYRVGYGHRTANDYTAGDGQKLPSSLNSRDWDVALGYDPTDDSRIEFSYLRLDQTGVQFPGAFFDIDYLVTDGYELKYEIVDQSAFDRFEIEGWYNRTRFSGNGNSPSKRNQVPQLDAFVEYVYTAADTSSTGYTSALTWGDQDDLNLRAGSDLRYLKQEINEFSLSPGFGLPLPIFSGVPDGHTSNPGLFIELNSPVNEPFRFRTGARVDWQTADVDSIPPGNDFNPMGQMPVTRDSLLHTLAVSSLNRSYQMWALFATAEYDLSDEVTLTFGAGHSQRPPTITEMYAFGSFLAVLQNGLNAVVGNPDLKPARSTQLDLGLRADYGNLRLGANGFHSWVNDFVTYENILNQETFFGFNSLVLRPTNTQLATLTGGEMFGEYDMNDWLTGFATLSYVRGQDHTRSKGGQHTFDFANSTVTYDPSLPRGVDVGPTGTVVTANSEALPGIAPLESRLGLRLHDPVSNRWSAEFVTRLVSSQNRVARTLNEQATAGFATFDIRTAFRPTDNLSIIFGVENLADKFYREHLDLRTGRGVYQPGRNFYFGTELVY